MSASSSSSSSSSSSFNYVSLQYTRWICDIGEAQSYKSGSHFVFLFDWAAPLSHWSMCRFSPLNFLSSSISFCLPIISYHNHSLNFKTAKRRGLTQLFLFNYMSLQYAGWTCDTGAAQSYKIPVTLYFYLIELRHCHIDLCVDSRHLNIYLLLFLLFTNHFISKSLSKLQNCQAKRTDSSISLQPYEFTTREVNMWCWRGSIIQKPSNLVFLFDWAASVLHWSMHPIRLFSFSIIFIR